MTIDSKKIIEENNFLFDFMISEKTKYYKRAISIKLSVLVIGSLYIISRFSPDLIHDSIITAIIVCGVLISMIALPLFLIKNETLLPSKARRRFYYTYKIQLAGNIIKLISERLKYKPQNRILNNVIIQSEMFGENITEFKGRNLIYGQFDNSEIQMSELRLWKGMRCKFEGLFVYVSNIDQSKIDFDAIIKLNGKWNVRNKNLFLAFSDIKKLFEVKIERSNRSIDSLRYQIDFIINVLQIAGKSADIIFNSEYKVTNLHSTSDDVLMPFNTYINPSSKAIFKLASSSRRFYNMLIDQSIITITWSIIFFFFLRFVPSLDSELIQISSYLLIDFLYYVITESTFSQTIGKLITKTRVITNTGEKPELFIIIKRTLCRFIPLEAYSFINNEIGLHDRYSRTIVTID